MQQLVHHPADGMADLAERVIVEPAEPSVQARQLRVHDLGGLRPQRDHRGGDAGGPRRRSPGGEFLGHDGPDRGHVLAGGTGAGRPPAAAPIASRSIRLIPASAAAPGSTSRGRARSSSTSGAPPRRAMTPASAALVITTPAAPVQEITRSAARICFGELGEAGRRAAQRGRQPFGLVRGAVSHDDGRRAHPGRGAGGERAHRAGAHDQHAAAGQGAIPGGPPVAGQPGGREPDAHADQVRAGPVDPGLGVRPLPGAQGQRAEPGELAAQRLLRARHAERLPDLAQDLALADHHRVQAAGDVEQVLHGTVLVVHVQVRGEVGQRDTGMPGQQVADRADAAVELVHLGVDFHPVAGGHDEVPATCSAPNTSRRSLSRSSPPSAARSSVPTGALL